MIIRLLAAAMLLFTAGSASARHIVLSNDDGLTANVYALYHALKDQGHDVVVSVPCRNQSGMGAAMKFLRPLGPLASDCLHNAAKAGDPGAGPMTRDGLPDFYYVDGTPVMAMLYGVDVVGQKRWGKAPDLVLSGINEGRNTGMIVLASGTVSNARIALSRGIPAIAFSAGRGTAGGEGLESEVSASVARLATDLVSQLDDRAGAGEPMLPMGMGLNVNFPDDFSEAKWVASQIGTFSEFTPRFAEDMGKSMAKDPRLSALAGGAAFPRLPGLIVSLPSAGPTAGQMHDEAVVSQHDISVSPLLAGYGDGAKEARAWVGQLLNQAGPE